MLNLPDFVLDIITCQNNILDKLDLKSSCLVTDLRQVY